MRSSSHGVFWSDRFPTTEPNREVGTVHPKAMPVILTRPNELEIWLTAPIIDALRLQRPLPDGALAFVNAPGPVE